jgi:hypothetical protein
MGKVERMMDKYPIPHYAVSVWVAGDNLMVAFPGTASEQGHTIKLPVSAGGLKAALSILRDRAQARDLRLGNRGTPIQWVIESDKNYKAWLKAMAEVKKERAKSPDQLLEELDL